MIENFDGADCVWIALDRNGYLAAFITAGIGPIFVSAYKQFVISEDTEAYICGLAHTSEVRLLVNVPRPDDFIALAARGFFVYDWQDVYRTDKNRLSAYEMVAVPLTPLHISNAPEKIKEIVDTVELTDILFATEQRVSIR